jgi:hypothetical protein
MQQYRVRWEIDLDAESPKQAARIARNIQLEPGNEATVFSVIDEEKTMVMIDLLEE